MIEEPASPDADQTPWASARLRLVAAGVLGIACLFGLSAQAQDAGSSGGAATGGASASGSGAAPASGAPATPGAEPEQPRPATPNLFEGVTTLAPDTPSLLRALNTPSGLTNAFTPAAPRYGFHYFVEESVRYDDNVRRLVDGAPTAPGRSRGDFYSTTNFGASAATRLGLQVFSISGSYGLTRYARSSDLDRSRYNVRAGVDWRIGYPCAGSLYFTADQSETEFQDVVVGAFSAVTTTERIDLAGRCHIYGRFYGLFGAGFRQYRVSNTPGNDSRQANARIGLEYSVPKLHTIGVEAVYLKNDFFNRVSTPLAPLATELTQTDYRIYYNYIVSPKTSIRLAGGLAEFETIAGASRSSRMVPYYSASVNWRATPKIYVNLAAQVSAGPPQGLLADYQRTEAYTATIAYQYSRKLSFSTNYAHQRTSTSIFSPISGIQISQTSLSDTFAIDANYRWTPFLSAGLGYRFSQRTDKVTGLKSTSNLYTVSLSYRR